MTELLSVLIAIALLVHGLSHIVWFMAAWTPYKMGVEDAPWILPGNVTLTGVVGHILGLVALLAMALLVFAALMLIAQDDAWRGAARMGAFLSITVVLPWWPRMPHRLGLQAIIVDIVLLFVVALPLSLEVIDRT